MTTVTDSQTRRTWRTLFILAQLALGLIFAAAFFFGPTLLTVALGVTSTALSGVYIALRTS